MTSLGFRASTFAVEALSFSQLWRFGSQTVTSNHNDKP
jgi:hypothetical protein